MTTLQTAALPPSDLNVAIPELRSRVTLPNSGDPIAIVRENSILRCEFNVMPHKPVAESLFIKEYRVWPWYVEGIFDREYASSMLNSPQHLVFLTALAHTQKLAYVWAAHHFGFGYETGAPEKVKFWWNRVNIKLPKLITTEVGCVQTFEVTRFRRLSDKKYSLHFEMRVESGLFVEGSTPVFVI